MNIILEKIKDKEVSEVRKELSDDNLYKNKKNNITDFEKVLHLKFILSKIKKEFNKDKVFQFNRELKRIIYSSLNIENRDNFVELYKKNINYEYQDYGYIIMEMGFIMNNMNKNLIIKREDRNIELYAQLLSLSNKLVVLFPLN